MLWVRLPRFLYGRLRLRRGVGRLIMLAARAWRPAHLLPVPLTDGRYLQLDLREAMSMPYLLTGEIWEERGETHLVRALVRRGESALDIGANVGWYSTLLSELVGPQGRVYAFEPGNAAFRMLEASARTYSQLTPLRVAVGDSEGTGALYIPLDGGQAALRPLPASLTVQECRTITLDRWLAEHPSETPVFVKCDAEGAEKSILRGAAGLLGRERPPAWLIELSAATTDRFGYRPEEVFDVFREFPAAGYRAFRINSLTARLESPPIPVTFRYDAFFVPSWLLERASALLQAPSLVPEPGHEALAGR